MNDHHRLSIRLVPGGFCFSADDAVPTFVNIAPGADYEKRLEDAILDLDFNAGDEDVECSVETARISLSPVACSEDEAEEMYRMTLRTLDAEEKILHSITQSGEVRVSFGIDAAFHNFLVRTYQYVSFSHPIAGLIDNEEKEPHEGSEWMTVQVLQGMMFIVAFSDHKLVLANCVETMQTDSRSYHVLNTWTKLGFDVLLDTLYIIGIEDEARRLRTAVSDFIKNIK